MLRVLRKIIEILDGTPAVYGKQQRGQSMVELALVSPLLIFVLAGMVEIGWFARNYMILLEVTRVGARTATVQEGDLSPLQWDNAGSILPGNYDNPSFEDTFPEPDFNADYRTVGWPATFRNCNAAAGSSAEFGFYNFVACIMQRSLDPLPFGRKQRDAGPDDIIPDDIVISAFAVQTVDPAQIPNTGAWGPIRSDMQWPLGESAGPQGIVVGRWPTNANECHYNASGGNFPGDTNDDGLDGRDPFDWIKDQGRDLSPAAPSGATDDRYYLEIAEPDSGTREKQRGFAWNGVHQIEGTSCYGSEWGIRDVENLINLQHFNLDTSHRSYVPSQGLVLVEMWWQHETISQFVGLAPVISPVFAILGEDTTIYVWAAFPLPQVEPRIDFSH